MRLAVYLPLLMPLLASLAARPMADRLRPWVAAWTVTIAAIVLAVSALSALGFLAAAGLAQMPLLAALRGYPSGRVRAQDPASLAVGVIAALLLVAALANAARVVWRRLLALAGAADEAARLQTDSEVVVTDDDACDAYAVPGFPGRIVVSSAMLAALTPGERTVLLTHERAHLRRGHVLFVSAVRCATAAIPLLIPLQRVMEYSVERWADEIAAAATGDRRGTAVAIAKAALAGAGQHATRPSAALGIAGASGGPVPRRVAAMLAPARPSHPVAVLLAASGLLLAAGSAAEGARDLHAMLLVIGLLH